MVENINKNKKGTRLVLKKHNLIQSLLIILLITVFIIISNQLFFRKDLTKEKRFSITDFSISILNNIDDVVYIEVFLEDNNLPVELIRYRKTVKEFLDNLKSYSNKIEYQFKNPFEEGNLEFNKDVYWQLFNKGLNPTFINQSEGSGVSEKLIFAGALVKYKETEYPVNLLNNNIQTSDSYVGSSETELERDFMHAIWMLTNRTTQKIAFLEEHNELDEYQTTDIMTTLSKYYQIDRVKMSGILTALDEYSAVIIARPQRAYNEKEKFIIDQYIMNGGKIIWMVQWLEMSLDSLSQTPTAMAMLRDVNISDQLFNYGARINPDLIQDLRCLSIPVNVNTVNGQSQIEPKPWYYFPLIIPDTLLTHSLLKNLEPIRTSFVSSIDTVGENPDIKKTILLRTSKFSKVINHPVEVSLELMRETPEYKTFSKPHIPIAVLLEGEFESNYINRLPHEFYESEDFVFKEKSSPTKMIVISDGNFAENPVKTIGQKKQALPLGADRYFPEQYTPGNSQFIVNCVNYLCADEDLISLRMREVKIRKLNSTIVKNDRTMWTYLNSIAPIIIIIITGLIVFCIRKYKYSKRPRIISQTKK